VARPVKRWYEDKMAFNTIGFHPVPSTASGAGLLPEVVYHAYPCEIEDDGISAPGFVGDYLEFQAIGEAYSKESDLQMPEVAQAARGIAALYESIIGNLWGPAQ
jgi:hypothetical protein